MRQILRNKVQRSTLLCTLFSHPVALHVRY